MKLSLTIALLASAFGFVAAEELGIEVTHAVECDRKSKAGDQIEVHYKGTLASTGEKFDSSFDRNRPLGFKLGGGQVIKGWDQGLLDMCPGEKRTLTIPPEFGYGDRGVGPIPGGATLIFETELVSIKGVPSKFIRGRETGDHARPPLRPPGPPRRHGRPLAARLGLRRPLRPVALHYAYFLALTAISSALFWLAGPGTDDDGASYSDGLFLAVSALTNTGLATIPPSGLTTAQQAVLWVLMILGSAIWVSFWMLIFRRQAQAHGRGKGKGRETGWLGDELFGGRGSSRGDMVGYELLSGLPSATVPGEKEKVESEPSAAFEGESVAVGSGASVFSGSLTSTNNFQSHQPSSQAQSSSSSAPPPPLPPAPSSHSEALAAAAHPEEPYALTLLALAIPLYAVLWVAVSTLVLTTYLAAHLPPEPEAGVGGRPAPRWSAAFLAASSFTNCGMTLFDSNLEPYHRSPVILGLTATLVLAGNTAFPAFLRLMVWALRAAAPRRLFRGERAALAFVLRSPRRVYTHLFPARQTWWLVLMLAGTTAVDWVAFEAMSFGNPALERIPIGSRILDGLFQAITVRGSGFHVVPVWELYRGLRLLYMVMMYTSAFPIVIAMRHASVPSASVDKLHGEKEDDPELGFHGPKSGKISTLSRIRSLLSPRARSNTTSRTHPAIGGPRGRGRGRGTTSPLLGRQIRAQLLHDAWLLPSVVVVIGLLECSRCATSYSLPSIFNAGSLHQKDIPLASLFDVAFEVVSAYGCVGMSVGAFSGPASLCGDWGVWSKMVLVGVMLKGRHRGLSIVLGDVEGWEEDEGE
ncbi:uncharacterized protein DNG_08854 [Cephalotrichum gorgonifer]|uniref:peptidylprolyl isomerase n=1 Tax=Cephalotrichum gorgonifer TaxID=2041049 RepID=A0AAE8SYQ8_9PEZI|nr:uncharacterized protein DNG_08854 [Cephalotrichum gorgonifer]